MLTERYLDMIEEIKNNAKKEEVSGNGGVATVKNELCYYEMVNCDTYCSKIQRFKCWLFGWWYRRKYERS